jgi:Xaa-Pro aminopeptidase
VRPAAGRGASGQGRGAGPQRLAFPPVVAGGANALTLHYVRNGSRLNDGECVPMHRLREQCTARYI